MLGPANGSCAKQAMKEKMRRPGHEAKMLKTWSGQASWIDVQMCRCKDRQGDHACNAWQGDCAEKVE
eukprot:7270502-Alexandrium_andersonii.AAC.1